MSRPTLIAAERYLGLAIILGIVLLLFAVGGGVLLSRRQLTPTPSTTSPASSNITLTIDFGDNSRKQFTDLPFTPGMTVLDTLIAAKSHARGVPSEISGSRDKALVISIDGIKNEGGGSKTKNWQFWVGDQFAHQSAGATILHPGDRVVWIFRPWEDDPKPPRP